VSTVNLETVLSSNLTNLRSVVIDERGESETGEGGSAVELYLELQKNIVNTSGWNEYIISITNPNEEDIQKTIYLEGTRYNWDATGCWVRASDFDGKIVATLENMTVRSGDTVQVRVPVQLEATGERNFYIFKVRG
jgi:predicted RNA-binding protein (virulence factor B family)